MHSILDKYPPIWVTKINDNIYVNNALILQNVSNYRAHNRLDPYGKEQALHIIDEVLDPIKNATNAYKLMEDWKLWHLPYSVEKYRRKVVQNAMHTNFIKEGSHTFFIPIDNEDDNMNLIDSYVIQGHIIPDVVLFTRPAFKHFPYETMANDGYINAVLVLFETDNRLFVKSTTLQGDSNHPRGEIITEIVFANIPVQNGVVHLIRNPLMVIKRPLRLFPYLPIYDKITMDPTLNTTYHLAEKIGLNDQFKNDMKLFTYFVPRDRAWKRLKESFDTEEDIKMIENNARSILRRHVIEANEMYSMDKLEMLTKDSEDGIEFQTQNGLLKMKVIKKGGDYKIMLKDKYVNVYRANYECSNGVVHIVDEVMVTKEELKEYNIEYLRDRKIYTLLSLVRMFKL